MSRFLEHLGLKSLISSLFKDWTNMNQNDICLATFTVDPSVQNFIEVR
jgi:hypothetical protein